jgi:hypothetical protein
MVKYGSIRAFPQRDSTPVCLSAIDRQTELFSAQRPSGGGAFVGVPQKRKRTMPGHRPSEKSGTGSMAQDSVSLRMVRNCFIAGDKTLFFL